MSKLPLKVGLTGGIACGKSLASEAFAALGISIVDADVIAREVVAPGSAGQKQLAAALGSRYFDAAGRLDRAALRRAMFADPALRDRVEAILHPLIRDRLLAQAAIAKGPYVVIAVPLLVEAGLHREMDATVVVDCPKALQRERLRRRDGDSDAEIDRILDSQAGRDQRLQAADYVLRNEGTPADLEQQVENLDRELRQRVAQRRA